MKPTIIFSLAALCRCLAATTLPAQATDANAVRNEAYQHSVEQNQLQLQADRLRKELTALLEESRQNSASPADCALLQQVIERLGNVGDRDMGAVVQTLREASQLQDASAAQGRLVAASNGQQTIQSALKTLTDRLTLHQTREGVEGRLRALVERQTANLRHTREIAAAGQPPRALPRDQQAAARLCVSEQAALRNEVDLLSGALSKAASGDGKDPDAGVFTATLKLGEELGLAQQALTAANDTNANAFTKAAGSQQAMLMSLETMAAKMASSQSAAERLRASGARLDDLARRQQELADAVRSANAGDMAKLRERQRQLADQVAALRAEVASVDAQTAGQLEGAERALQTADDLLKNPELAKPARGKAAEAADAKSRGQAADAQADARRQLEAAGETLTARADALQAETKPSADAARATAQLQQLQQQTSQTLAQQQALSGQPASPAAAAQQQQLAAALENMQRQALPLDTDLANTLGQAAQVARQPQDSLPPTPGPTPSPSPQGVPAAGQMAQAQKAPTPAADHTPPPPPPPAVALLTRAQAQLQADRQAAARAAAAQQALQTLSGLLRTAKSQAAEGARLLTQTTADDLTPAIQQADAADASIQQAFVLIARGQATPLPKGVPDNLNAARADLATCRLQAAQVQRKPALAANERAQADLDAAIALAQQALTQTLAQALPSSALAQNRNQTDAQSQPPQGQPTPPAPQGSLAQGAPPVPPPSGQATPGQPTSPAPSSRNQASTQNGSGSSQAGRPSPSSQPGGSPPSFTSPQTAQDSRQPASGQPNNDSRQSDSRQPDGSQPNSGPGSGDTTREHRIAGNGPLTRYTVVAGPTAAAQRDTVTLFQHEKVPAEYNEMVQQYSKNLAEGSALGH